MRPYRVAIITIGAEVLSGDTHNTNATWLARRCTQCGAVVIEQRSIADEVDVIAETLEELRVKSELVITTGGLGPTHDDVTKEALCRVLNDQLVQNRSVYHELQQRLQRQERPLTERIISQSYLPSQAQVLPNSVGTAPGLLFVRSDGASVLALPGVPREMESIMEQHGIVWLERTIAQGGYDVVGECVLTIAGMPESELADRIESIRTQFPAQVEVAFRPSSLVVRLCLRAVGEQAQVRHLLEKCTAQLKPLIGAALISEHGESLVRVLQRECIARGKTLAVAESCTGGMLGMEITAIPGSSAYFVGGLICYADSVKIHFGGVRPETIPTHGAVSKETVMELARYIRAAYGTDLAVAISGIAGPGGGSEEKPVGTVWIAVADGRETVARLHHFGSDRYTIRQRACTAALLMVLERLRMNSEPSFQ